MLRNRVSRRRYVYPAVAALLFLLPPAHAQNSPFTLEQILSVPFPTGMSAATDGGAVAWVQNARGVRNIWIASPPEYRGRQLTGYAEDDGQEITAIQWSPDGKTLIFVRGGAPNRQGEIPNPTSNPEGAERALWRISIDGGQPESIAEGSGAAISPKGDGLVFVSRGQIHWAPLNGSQQPKPLVKARGGAGSLRWSPDGSKLAFVSNRGTHSFIGVYNLDSKVLSFLDPTVDRDSNPVWSPDGTRLAYTRFPTSSRLRSFRPIRSGRPWSIMVGNVNTGQGERIWHADEGPGSVFRAIVAEDQLLWGIRDQLVFPWEADGWTHLYSISVDGGNPTLLTPGDFEVEHVSLGPDRRTVVFSSNQDDIDRRHIWRIDLTGGPAEAVTKGVGIEWEPSVTSDGEAIAFFRSGDRRQARAVITFNGEEPQDLAPESMPSDFPELKLVRPEQVIFSASDGMKIHGQLFLPARSDADERHPAVLFFHGGSRRQMLLGWHYRGYYNNAYGLNQFLASRGYVVLSVNYRSGTGYGMEFREALNYGASGASEFNDVLGAGLYLRSRPDVDPERIGLWGGSYGGYLTAMGLSRASDLFAAGVDLHGVHDWNVGIRNFIPSYNALEIPEQARLAFESSPMAAIDSWRSPVLLIHGDDDRNVAFIETVTLVEALRERDVEVEQLIFPDEVHGFLLHSRWLRAYHAAADFFDRKLKNR